MKGLIAYALITGLGLQAGAAANDDSYELKARFTTNIMFTSLPLTEVQKLLSEELKISAADGGKLDSSANELANKYYHLEVSEYPVVILQGSHSNMTNPAGEIFVNLGRPLISYNEVAVVIPKVMYKGRAFNYMKRLYLDKALPVAVGRLKQGFDKLLGEFQTQTTDTTEKVQVSYKGKKVVDVSADILPAKTNVDFMGLFSSLLGEDYLSFRRVGPITDIICTRISSAAPVKNSLYPINMQANIGAGFFTDENVTPSSSDVLYQLSGRGTSMRLVYDWFLYPVDVGCKLVK